MDRKDEFRTRVDVIQRAHHSHDRDTLWPATAALHEEVAALRRRLVSGDRLAVSEALDLLEICRPAFFVGYEQEKLARSLKKAPLDESDLGRVEHIVLRLIESTLTGGQLRELVRVVVGRSSAGFRESLKQLALSKNMVTRRRASRTLEVVLHGGATQQRNAADGRRR
jgi:hypothetical protein